jgi:predicted phosphodiesterase
VTRLAILADIHGNLPALEAVIADMQQFNVDQVIVVGDSINWGPYSAEVMERIYRMGCAVIRGNHELYLLEYQTPREPAHWRHYTLPRWLNETIPARWKNIIAAQPDTLCLRFPDAPPVRVVHGIPDDHWTAMFPSTTDDDITTWLANTEENTVISGHSHVPMERRVGKWHILNAGSVGVPLDGIHDADYLILESKGTRWISELRRIPYDITPVLAEFDRIGFVEACGVTGLMIYEELRTARPYVDPFNRWYQKCYPNQPQTMAMGEEYLALDNKGDYMLPDFRG